MFNTFSFGEEGSNVSLRLRARQITREIFQFNACFHGRFFVHISCKCKLPSFDINSSEENKQLSNCFGFPFSNTARQISNGPLAAYTPNQFVNFMRDSYKLKIPLPYVREINFFASQGNPKLFQRKLKFFFLGPRT